MASVWPLRKGPHKRLAFGHFRNVKEERCEAALKWPAFGHFINAGHLRNAGHFRNSGHSRNSGHLGNTGHLRNVKEERGEAGRGGGPSSSVGGSLPVRVAFVRVCVRVCVRERERETERGCGRECMEVSTNTTLDAERAGATLSHRTYLPISFQKSTPP